MTAPGGSPASTEPKAPDLAALLQFGARFAKDIRPATPADLAAMASIHANSGTPGLLTDLGERFLRDVYYAGLVDSPFGVARVLEVDGEVGGFSTCSPDSGRLFRDIFGRRLWATGLAVLRASLRRPRVLFDFVQTAFTADSPGQGADIRAELVTLEVAPRLQGLGLGFVLLQTSVAELRASGARQIKARILVQNAAVERLYPPLGFRHGPRFRLHGRDWVLLVLDGD